MKEDLKYIFNINKEIDTLYEVNKSIFLKESDAIEYSNQIKIEINVYKRKDIENESVEQLTENNESISTKPNKKNNKK